jgi:hypothetical protein
MVLVMSKRLLSNFDIAYLNGLLSAFEDLPDGAWQAACEESIRACGRFKRHDPYDVWLAWVEATAEVKS